MEITNQSQRAGDNSNQIQADTVVFQYGITEQRARELYAEMSKKAIEECTTEAFQIANERVNKFENDLIPRMQKIESNFNSFADPSFQVLLKKAQLAAACSDRDTDYKILSELLVHRAKNKENVKKKASIAKAVEIIDQIDEDSLLALTVFLCMSLFTPATGNIDKGITKMSSLYSKFDLSALPTDNSWVDNLSILGAITTNSIASLKKFEDYFSENLNGYACAGIKKDSDDYYKAREMLSSCKIDKSIFENNALVEGYVRLSVPTKAALESLNLNFRINDNGEQIVIKSPINKEQVECLNKIFDMYSKDSTAVSQAKENFKNLLHTYPPIHQAIEWWNSISGAIHLTSIGRVIGHTNAKSIDQSLPDLD